MNPFLESILLKVGTEDARQRWAREYPMLTSSEKQRVGSVLENILELRSQTQSLLEGNGFSYWGLDESLGYLKRFVGFTHMFYRKKGAMFALSWGLPDYSILAETKSQKLPSRRVKNEVLAGCTTAFKDGLGWGSVLSLTGAGFLGYFGMLFIGAAYCTTLPTLNPDYISLYEGIPMMFGSGIYALGGLKLMTDPIRRKGKDLFGKRRLVRDWKKGEITIHTGLDSIIRLDKLATS